jgi:TolB-like protein
VRVRWELVVLLWVTACAGPRTAPLEFESLVRDDVGTPVAGSTKVRWTVSTRGGAGDLRYEFRTAQGSVEIVEQEGPSPTWQWNPLIPGAFRVKATVEDGAGARVGSGWSSEIVVAPPIDRSALIAVLPVANLSGGAAPLRAIGQILRSTLRERGFRLLDDAVLEEFMGRHRIRTTGGLASAQSRAIREETGADAYLVSSVEAHRDADPVLVALISRLVLAREGAEIVWMDSVALAGGSHPGFLGLGFVDDPEILLEQATQCLSDSLGRSIPEAGAPIPAASANTDYGCDARADVVALSPERRGRARHRPHVIFRSPTLRPDRRYRVAVVPFLNLSDRKNAGTITGLHFVKHLSRSARFRVVDPGLVREHLLRYRLIMEAGPSLANAEILSSDVSLGVDLVISGTVFDYQDVAGVPKVQFSLKIIDGRSRQLVWSSRSHNDGDEGVVFFDVGRIYTAHQLASDMAWGTFEALTR